jgi:hypothetical protein
MAQVAGEINLNISFFGNDLRFSAIKIQSTSWSYVDIDGMAIHLSEGMV